MPSSSHSRCVAWPTAHACDHRVGQPADDPDDEIADRPGLTSDEQVELKQELAEAREELARARRAGGQARDHAVVAALESGERLFSGRNLFLDFLLDLDPILPILSPWAAKFGYRI